MAKKKAVILTGAQGGIGRAITRKLISDGSFVVAIDINDRGIFLKEKNVISLSCDISNEEKVQTTFSKIKEEFE